MSNSWLISQKTDLSFFFLPLVAIWVVIFLLPSSVLDHNLPLWAWAVFILGFDVSHVWSTLFRTYTDKDETERLGRKAWSIPLISFLAVFVLCFFSVHLFWRLLAYLAVSHFAKQQFGFLALYRVRQGRIRKRIPDKLAIYLAVLYPVVYWHVAQDRAFEWFVSGDFVFLKHIQLPYQKLIITNVLYWAILAAWLIEECITSIKQVGKIAYGKIAWVLVTAFNWYFGIVHFNSDIVFSITNVVAHGLPYMVLVVWYKLRKNTSLNRSVPVFQMIATIIFGAIILAYIEEFGWDMLLFREKGELFPAYFVGIFEGSLAIAFAYALLALPQITHYILDGIIWKNSASNPYVKQML